MDAYPEPLNGTGMDGDAAREMNGFYSSDFHGWASGIIGEGLRLVNIVVDNKIGRK
jgi:hypothetical protein